MKSVERIPIELFDWSDASGLCYAVRFGPTWHSAESRRRRAHGFAACRLSVGRWVSVRAIDPRCGGGRRRQHACEHGSAAVTNWTAPGSGPPTDVPATSSRAALGEIYSRRLLIGEGVTQSTPSPASIGLQCSRRRPDVICIHDQLMPTASRRRASIKLLVSRVFSFLLFRSCETPKP